MSWLVVSKIFLVKKSRESLSCGVCCVWNKFCQLNFRVWLLSSKLKQKMLKSQVLSLWKYQLLTLRWPYFSRSVLKILPCVIFCSDIWLLWSSSIVKECCEPGPGKRQKGSVKPLEAICLVLATQKKLRHFILSWGKWSGNKLAMFWSFDSAVDHKCCWWPQMANTR